MLTDVNKAVVGNSEKQLPEDARRPRGPGLGGGRFVRYPPGKEAPALCEDRPDTSTSQG